MCSTRKVSKRKRALIKAVAATSSFILTCLGCLPSLLRNEARSYGESENESKRTHCAPSMVVAIFFLRVFALWNNGRRICP